MVVFWLVLVLRAVALVLFAVALGRALSIRSRMVSSEARHLLTFVALTSGVFALASLEELVVVSGALDAAPDHSVYGWLGLLLATTLVGLAGFGLHAMHEFSHGLDRRLTALDVLSHEGDVDVPALDMATLTPRERQLVELLVSGTTSDEQLARELSVAEATAATHVRNILRKTGLTSRRQLIVAAAASRGATRQD